MRIPKGNDEPKWTPLPVGRYDILITKVDSNRMSRGKDPKPQVMIQGEVASDEYNGKKVTEFFFATPKAFWRVENLFKALGIEGEPTGDHDEATGAEILDYPEEELLERVVSVSITQETYTDKAGDEKVSNDWDASSYKISSLDQFYDEVIKEQAEAASQSDSEEADEDPVEAAAEAPQAPAKPAPGRRRRRQA